MSSNSAVIDLVQCYVAISVFYCSTVNCTVIYVFIISFFIVGKRPNLPHLISFPGRRGKINIPQQIGAKYLMFGVLLLNDETGAKVSAIVAKYHGDAEQINLEILKLWIKGNGKPLNWDKLIGVLKDIGLSTLAGDLQDGLQY